MFVLWHRVLAESTVLNMESAVGIYAQIHTKMVKGETLWDYLVKKHVYFVMQK